MKRDMELVRILLLRVEELPMRPGEVQGFNWGSTFFDVDGYDNDTGVRHFGLLMDAGFIDMPRTQGATAYYFRGLTWSGHEFLDTIRNPEIWRRTKAGMQKVGGFGLDLMLQLAKAEGKRLVTEKLGIPL